MKKSDLFSDGNFENLLRLRRMVPPPHADLNARIARAAWQRAAAAPVRALDLWLREFLADFVLPKPAYAFAGVVLVGLFMGYVCMPALMAEDASASGQIILADEGDMP